MAAGCGGAGVRCERTTAGELGCGLLGPLFLSCLISGLVNKTGCRSPGSGTWGALLERRAAVLGTQEAGSEGTALQVGTAGSRPSPRAAGLAQQPGTGARWLGQLWPWGALAPGTGACASAGLGCPRVFVHRASESLPCPGDRLGIGLRVSRTPRSAGNCVDADACPCGAQAS